MATVGKIVIKGSLIFVPDTADFHVADFDDGIVEVGEVEIPIEVSYSTANSTPAFGVHPKDVPGLAR